MRRSRILTICLSVVVLYMGFRVLISGFSTNAPITPESIVRQALEQNRVVIFSKTYCGFSLRAKQMFNTHLGDGNYKVYELDERPDGQEILQVLATQTGTQPTVPKIFIDGKFIGGHDDCAKLNSSGELQSMLKEKGLLT